MRTIDTHTHVLTQETAALLTKEGARVEIAPFDAAEVHRVDLGSTVLALHSWGVREPDRFGWFEPPSPDRVAAAEALLGRLGALDPESRSITPMGRRMLALPAHPRLARLLLAAAGEGVLHEGAALAALLAEKDVAERRPGGRGRGRRRAHRRRRGHAGDVLEQPVALLRGERRRRDQVAHAQLLGGFGELGGSLAELDRELVHVHGGPPGIVRDHHPSAGRPQT